MRYILMGLLTAMLTLPALAQLSLLKTMTPPIPTHLLTAMKAERDRACGKRL